MKYLVLLTSLFMLFLLLLKIKYLMLEIYSKKSDCNIKINEIEKKITDHDNIINIVVNIGHK